MIELGQNMLAPARGVAGAFQQLRRTKDALEWRRLALENVDLDSQLRPVLELDLARSLIADGKM